MSSSERSIFWPKDRPFYRKPGVYVAMAAFFFGLAVILPKTGAVVDITVRER